MPPIARAVRSPTDLTTKLRLPTFATTTARHVPGPAGSPSLAVVHGGEVIRQGAHDDAMVGAINNLSEAIGTIRSGDMSVQPKIVVMVDGQVIEQSQRNRTRRDGIGRGVRTPAANLGVATAS